LTTSRLERLSPLAGLAAVALWVAGAVISWGVVPSLPDDAGDTRVLAWAQAHRNGLLAGGWLWVLGCLCFVWFLGALRARLVVAEGGAGTFSAIAFAGGVATAVCGLLMMGGNVALALDASDVSPATAGALSHLSDVFFGGAELFAVLLLGGVAVLGFATGVVGRWFAGASVVLAVILVVLPIGWLGLLFGVPLWTLAATALLVRPARARRVAVATA
jgi:hypothetical protein